MSLSSFFLFLSVCCHHHHHVPTHRLGPPRYYYLSLSRRNGTSLMFVCLLYGRILSSKNLLTITRPFLYIYIYTYIDEGSFLRRETCPLSRIEFRLFRRPNFLSITPLSVCFLSVFYFIVDYEFMYRGGHFDCYSKQK